VHELQEAGWFPFLEAHAYDVSSTLPDNEGIGAILRGLVGFNADPGVLEVLAWLTYLVVVGFLYLRPYTTLSSRSPVADTARR